MNDRMDPLVANEGGIEAITLIIFYESETEKFTKIRNDEAQWERNNQQLSGYIKSNEGQRIDYFIFLFYLFYFECWKAKTKLNIFRIIKIYYFYGESQWKKVS